MEQQKLRWSLPRSLQHKISELTPHSHYKTKIYHESQKDLLCGRHCLNNLLQYPCFQTAHLREISHILHASEQSLLGSTEQSSANNYGSDEHGYFNVQVIDVALKSLNLSLKPFHTGVDLYQQTCFLINHLNHWFSIRKINNHWFNLDSKSKIEGEDGRPMLIETEDDLFIKLAQIMSETGQVFIVEGKIPNGSSEILPGLGFYYDKKSIKSESFYEKLAEEMEIKSIAKAMQVSEDEKEEKNGSDSGDEIIEKENTPTKREASGTEKSHLRRNSVQNKPDDYESVVNYSQQPDQFLFRRAPLTPHETFSPRRFSPLWM